MNETIIFPNLHITLENVGKTFTVFGIDIAYYGLIIAIGMLLGVALILHEAKRCGKNEDDYLDLCIYTIIFAVIGARLYYVILSWDLYRDNLLNIFNIRQGGLAIYGGVIAGIITGYIVCRIKKMRFLETADMVVLGLLVGQILGRWGNFFNREAFGQYTDGLFAMQLPLNAIRSMDDVTTEMLNHVELIGGDRFISVTPTFLYESLWNLALLCILLLLRKRKQFDGQIFFLYLLGYGIGRFWIEGMRTDQLLLWNTNIPVSQALAALLVIASLVLLGVGYVRMKARGENKDPEGKKVGDKVE